MKMKKWLKCLLMVLTLIMAVNVGTVGTTIPAAAKTKKETVTVGKKFKSGNFQYKVTSLKGKKGTATLTGTTTKSLTSVKVPETVKTGKYSLTVDAIGDNAFKNCRKLTKVTTNTALKKIGKNAFYGCSKLAAVNVKSKKLKSVGKDALKGISKKAVVTVPKGKEKKSPYKELKASVKTSAQTQTATTAKKTASTTTAAKKTASTATAAKKTVSTTTAAKKTVSASSPATPAATQTEAAPAAPQTEAAPAAPQTEAAPAAPQVQAAPQAPAAPVVQSAPAAQSAPTAKAPAEKKQETVQTEATCGKKHLGLVVVESVAPTCTETGLSSYEYCTVCNYRTTPLVLTALGHDFEHHAAVAATCTEAGQTAYDTCRRCGYATQPKKIEALGHDLVQHAAVIATCTKDGQTAYKTCTRCSYATKPEKVAALGHNLVHHAAIVATCTREGRTAYDTCTRCSYATVPQTVEKLAHNMMDVPGQDATCTTSGYKPYRVCRSCGYSEGYETISALGHSYVNWGVKNEATCTAAGTEEGTCERCGAKGTRPIAAKGHSMKFKNTENVPGTNCYMRDVYECEVCGYVEKSSAPVHRDDVLVSLPDIEATCVTAGKTNRKYCPYCRMENYSYVKPLGHSYSTEQFTEDPTCTKDGSVYRKCVRCSVRVNEKVIPKTGHSWTPLEEEATCTSKGFDGRVCTVCGEKEGTYTRALGHHYVQESVTAPTCGHDGVRKEKCETCGNVLEFTLTAPDHRWVEYPKEEATCAKAGHSAYAQCSRCKAYRDGQEPEVYERKQHVWKSVSASSVVKGAGSAEKDSECNVSSFVACQNCGEYKVIPGWGHVWQDPECTRSVCGFNANDPGCDAYIQWMVFLTETNWDAVDMAGQCSSLWMGEKKYAAYIPALRSTVKFNPPTPRCPEGKTFIGWRQVVSSGEDTVRYTAEYRGPKQPFNFRDMYRTYVAVFE